MCAITELYVSRPTCNEEFVYTQEGAGSQRFQLVRVYNTQHIERYDEGDIYWINAEKKVEV